MMLFIGIVFSLAFLCVCPWLLFLLVPAGVIWLIIMFGVVIMGHLLITGYVVICMTFLVWMVILIPG
jgi:hypothetical protein